MKKFKINPQLKLQRNKKKKASYAVNITGVIATTFSILILCVLYLLFDENNRGVIWQIFNSIALGSLPLGIISIIFSYFDKMSYVREHVANAIFDSKGYLYFNEEQQRKIKNEIERNLCLKDDDPHNLYSTVQNSLDEITQDVYINELILHIDCKLINHCFEKIVDETFEYILPSTRKESIRSIELSELIPSHLLQNPKLQKCDDIERKCQECTNKSCIRDYKLSVDNKDIDMQLVEKEPQFLSIEDYKQEYRYECKNKKDRKIIFKDKPVRLHLQFVSRVPISDPVYIFKCKRATRNFTIHFDYDPEELKVTPIGFGFMDKAMWNENMKISKFPRSIKIRFKNWLLPGNGVVFVIEEKKN